MLTPEHVERREQVRLLITDLDEENYLLTHAQIDSLLSLSGGDVRRAAARGLRTIAASEVLLSKKITTQDLSTDGPAVSAELRMLADQLDAEADTLEAKTVGLAWFVPGGGAGRCEGEEWHL